MRSQQISMFDGQRLTLDDAIDLINAEEEARIRELIALRTYPQKWSDDDPDAIELIPQTYSDGTRQELLLSLEVPHA